MDDDREELITEACDDYSNHLIDGYALWARIVEALRKTAD